MVDAFRSSAVPLEVRACGGYFADKRKMFFQLTKMSFDGQELVEPLDTTSGVSYEYSEEWIFENPNSMIFEHQSVSIWECLAEVLSWALYTANEELKDNKVEESGADAELLESF